MLTATKYPSSFVFAANPVVFEFISDTAAMREIELSVGESTFYMTAYPFKISATEYKLSVDVSDLISQRISFTYDATLTHQVNIPGFVTDYELTIGTEYTFSGKAIPGGVSKQFQQYMIDKQTNPFDFRFMNQLEPFFLITRTDSDTVSLSRNELCCLFFVSPENANMVVTASTGETLTVTPGAQGVACMINVPVWMSTLEDACAVTNVLFSFAGVVMFRIDITESFFEKSYLLKYRNSLGVFEFLEVSGEAKETPEFKGGDNYNIYNPDFSDFSKRNIRRQQNDKLTVTSGYKKGNVLRSISDLLLSDQVWFIDGQSKRRCMVTSDGFSINKQSTIPEYVSLSVEFSEEEIRYTPVSEVHTIDYILGTENNDIIITENGFMIGI